MKNIKLRVDKNLNENQKLWRYMDLSKFISLISTGSIWLAKSTTFKDQQEGKFPHEMQEELEAIYETYGKDENSEIKDAHDFKRFLCNNAYISCWHKNTDENMVMWGAYGNDTNVVSVQTTVESLAECFDTTKVEGINFLLKEINYSGHNKVTEKNYTAPFFLKRPHFKYENEARILLSTYSSYAPTDNTPLGYAYKVNTEKLIHEVLVHPDSEEWFVNVIKSVCIKYSINAKVSRGLHGNK